MSKFELIKELKDRNENIENKLEETNRKIEKK